MAPKTKPAPVKTKPMAAKATTTKPTTATKKSGKK